DALVHFRAAAAAFRAIGNLRDALAQEIDESYALNDIGAYAAAEKLLHRLIAETAAAGLHRLESTARVNLAVAQAGQGQDTRAAMRKSIAALDPTHLQTTMALSYQALVDYFAGDLAAAEVAARHAAAHTVYDARPMLAFVLIASGRAAEAA